MKTLGELFYMGGPGFMGVLTILLITMVAWIVYYFIVGYTSKMDANKVLRKLGYGRSIGLFAFITGILGQLIGLYMAFSDIAKVGNISPSVVFAGVKVSMIVTFYGFFIYLVSLILWFVATNIIERKLSKG
ncbi:MAG: MotA/TolQ/ExbB proton channel family protein [Bacteroidales bacterium]|nr:MotA/TolQ/ExbB proton channel family protein [Bacteroidales bacterium]